MASLSSDGLSLFTNIKALRIQPSTAVAQTHKEQVRVPGIVIEDHTHIKALRIQPGTPTHKGCLVL